MKPNQFEEKPKPTRRTWSKGPLIQCHKPMTDTSVKYVCDKCGQVAITGVRLRKQDWKWLCASCEEGKTRKAKR